MLWYPFYSCPFLFLFLFRYLFIPQKGKRDIILCGSKPQGQYTKIVRYLAKYLNKKLGNKYNFIAQISDGSVENIQNLHLGKAHIALVQEDVAHYFHYGGHKFLKVEHRSDNRVKAVCFFFWEYLFVISGRRKTKLQELKNVHIGSLHGGTGVTALNVKEQLQLFWEFKAGNSVYELLKNNKVDSQVALTSNIASRLKKLKENGVKYNIISLRRDDASGLTASFPFYYSTVLTIDKKNIRTIATRALLAVNQKTPNVIVSTIMELFRNDKAYTDFVKFCPELDNIYSNNNLKSRFEKNPRFSQFPIPVHPLVFELYWDKNPYLPYYIVAIPIFCLCFFILYLRRADRYKDIIGNWKILGIKGRFVFETLWGYVLLACVVFLYLLSAIYLIKYLEIQAFINNIIKIPSPFMTMNFQQLCTWVIVFTVTGYEDEIFPLTEVGKLIASTIRLVSIATVMFIVGRISADYIQNLVKGKKMEKGYNLKDHIVICNWNYKGQKIIEELHSSLLQKTGMARPVIVICEGDINFPDTPEFEDTFCIPGNPVSGWKLRNANVHHAFAVIILADMKREDADTHTIMVSMEIADLVENMKASGEITNEPHISAEILDNRNKKYLFRSGVHEVISSNSIGVKLLAQTAVTPGISAFMKDILQYSSESNEIYIIPPPVELVEKNASFTEISLYLLQHRETYHQAILVGVYSGTPPEMLVNPDASAFEGLSFDDKLVVMARERPVFDKG